jgi:hypothetical protein
MHFHLSLQTMHLLTFLISITLFACMLLFLLSLTDEDYILQFAHPFQRLELLRAQSPCPETITRHVEELSGAAH